MLEEGFDLPVGWKWATVAEVIDDAQPGFASGQKTVEGGLRHLRMNNIGADCRLNLDLVATVPMILLRSKYVLRPDDILVCHTNSLKLVGKTALFDLEDGPYAFSNHLTRLRVSPGMIDRRWLWHILATLWRERYFELRCKQWVNQATIERQTLLGAPVPLPPLPEQLRIVARLEALLHEARRTREALQRILPLVKRFRRSVLAAAFRGQLVPQDPRDEPAAALLERIRAERRQRWAAQGKDPARYMEPASPDAAALGELPAGWVWTKMDQIGDVSGGVAKNTRVQEGLRQWPYLRVANVYAAELRLDEIKTIGVEQGELPKVLLKRGDLLIVEGNGSLDQIGRVALWDGSIPNCVHQNHLIKVRFDIEGLGPYALWWLISTDGREQIQRVASSTSGLYTLSISKVSMLPVPLPSLAEQRRIVARIEALFAQADAVEAAVARGLRRLEQFERSVLARAFRGELLGR